MLKHSRQPLQSAEAAPWSLLLPWRCRLSVAPVTATSMWEDTQSFPSTRGSSARALLLTVDLGCKDSLSLAHPSSASHGDWCETVSSGGDTWRKFKVQINNDLKSYSSSLQLWSELSVHHKIWVLVPEFTGNMTVWLGARFLYVKTKQNRSMATITSKPQLIFLPLSQSSHS